MTAKCRCDSLTLLVVLDFLLVISGYAVGQAGSSIESKSWDFRGHFIGYEVANNKPSRKEPILLLNGFGVGSFHQHRLFPELVARDQNQVVYGMDYLGQGRSWPVDCDDGNSENEKGLLYSADMWVEQIICFIEEVIQSESKVHLVGNSIGGHLAAVVASRRPDLVASVSLLNATPVWGLNLPGWSGKLPPPAIPRKIGRVLFDWIRDIGTIEKYLETAYANREAFGQELMNQIRGCTEGKGGHAAFSSILWSPPATYQGDAKNFYQVLSQLQCDVLLLFGQDDPWCKPAFAKRMIQSLSDRQMNTHCCRYLQLSNVGHCPNHEAPKAVGKAVSAWVRATDRSKACLVEGSKEIFHEDWGVVAMQELGAHEIQVGLIDMLAATFV
jgi:pimeloyl-ACP methyl ester carboxylesterase